MSTLPSGDRRVDFSGWQRQYYQINGAVVVVHQAGEGTPVMYLHGGGTWHGLGFASGLMDRHKVYLPHHPGFGLSEDNANITSISDCVDHYANLLDTLGLQRVHLVGSSLGGRIVAEFAARYPDRVSKLVLAAPAGLSVAEHPLPDLSAIPLQDFPSYLVNDMQVLLPFLPNEPDEEFMSMRAREGGAVMRLLGQSGLDNPNMAEQLQHIDAPTLIIWGRLDRMLPVGRVESWKNNIFGAQVKVVEDAGHLPLDESAEARQALLDFLG
ncbi:alpha/beta fold hydrolase [Pseudomonas inefficax]|uniref:alpha/beta fold hydrolase n=1 Tax=Pseudomonas inefficax TaxID=2078786 RepID=UPI004046EAED